MYLVIIHTDGPPSGQKDTLERITPADVRAHHARTYSPDRITLAVAGPVAPKKVLDALLQAVSGVRATPRGPLPSVPKFTPPSSPSVVLSVGRAQRCINFGAPTVAASDDAFEILEVLMTVARGYHFYKYVYDLGVSYRSWVRLWPHRALSKRILENDLAAEGFQRTLASIRDDVRRFSTGFATDADVEVARRRLLNRALLDGQRTLYSAFELARSNVLGRGWKGPRQRITRLRAVTTAAVREMAKHVFGANPTYEVILQ